MQTKAAVCHGPHVPFKIETLDLKPPQNGEVLVQMSAAGVCHSDWHLVTGATVHPMPVVPGHEGAGVVMAVGDGVSHIKPGDHVALNWAPSCGSCFYCLNGKPNLCETYTGPIWAGTMLDGTTRLSLDGAPVYHFSGLACFSEYAVVPAVSCVPMPKEVPMTVAALIGCAVTTGVGAALYTAGVRPGSTVAVFGAGGVGLSIIMGARLAGASRIIAVDRSEAKGDLAQAFGATHVLMAGPSTVDEIKRLTGNRGADFTFEAIGIPAVQEESLAATRPGGMVIFVGLSAMGSSTNLPGAIIARQEKTIKGSYYGSTDPRRDFPFLADLYLQGKLDLDQMITRTYSLDQINEAYEDMLKGEGARGVIVF